MRLDSPDPAAARNIEIGAEVELTHFHSLSWREMDKTLPAPRVVLAPGPAVPDLAPGPPVPGPPVPGPAVPELAPARSLPESAPEPARRRRLAIRPAAGLLLIVLSVQGLLSLRLVRSNTAFQDEALYLWAGRLEWQHWLHGVPLPDLATYFSGAPVVYPPLGAAAAAVGGLTGARLLSLAFMLAATCLLWAAATRLLGTRTAFFACAAWAVLGPVQRLGAFATYDAMSLFLLALATWCAVRAAAARDCTRWLLAAAGAAVLANAAKYASAVFDPVMVAMAGFAACPRPGGKSAAARWTVVVTYVSAGIIGLLLAAGHSYELGIESTTLSRAGGGQSPLEVVAMAWRWTGVMLVAGGAGIALSALRPGRKPGRTPLLCVLVAAMLLVPAEQARIHTTISLDKHVAFGAWFGAIAAGYAADRIIAALPWTLVRAEVCAAIAIALLPVAAVGTGQARQLFGWPNATAFIRALRPLAERSTAPMLIETSSVAEYYLPSLTWQRWSNTFSITTPSGRSVGYSTRSITAFGQPGIYRRYIARRYFGLIALYFTAGSSTIDSQLGALLRRDRDYRVVASAPYGAARYIIWQRVPRQDRASLRRGRRGPGGRPASGDTAPGGASR